jgi:hypothetical protein
MISTAAATGAARVSTAFNLVWALSSKWRATRAIRSMVHSAKKLPDSSIAVREAL